MTIDVTLNNFLFPYAVGFEPKFGNITTRESGSLTSKELNENVAKLIDMDKSIIVTEDSQTSEVEYNTFFLIQNEGVTLTINNAIVEGCIVHIFAKENASVKYTSNSGTVIEKTVNRNKVIKLIWNSSYWVDTFDMLFDFVHPVGSLYWSSNPTNPSTLFGGTWKAIEDKFILSAGSTYKNGNTGGSASVTLVENNIPSHYHTMEHKHTYTPSGSVDSHYHTMKHSHEIPSVTGGSHSHEILVYTGNKRQSIGNKYAPNTESSNTGVYWCLVMGGTSNVYDINDNHSTASSYESSSGYARYANWGGKRNDSYKRRIIQSDGGHPHTGTASVSSVHTELEKLTLTTEQTTTEGSSQSNTGSYGKNTTEITAHDNMPPYIVRYCWERKA